MSSTFFIDYTTPIVADWLNDVNTGTYTTIPALSASVSNLQNTKVTQTSSTGSAVIPSGTTGQRDGSPLGGYFRYNNSLSGMEFWNGASWVQLASTGAFIPTTGGTLTGLLNFAVGSNIASAATVNLSSASGNTVHITGTTNITAWTLTSGQVMDVIFDSSLTLIHNATTNNLPSAANITTSSGDTARFFYDGTTVYCLSYTRITGTALVGQRMTLTSVVATTSGTSIDFTGIPSWAKRVTLLFSGVSTSGTSNTLVQIGDSGGVSTSGYTSAVHHGPNAGVSSTAGYIVDSSSSATSTRTGSVTLENVTGNIWVSRGMLNSATGFVDMSAGGKTLSLTLDRVRLTTANGTDTFDAGSASLLIEGY